MALPEKPSAPITFLLAGNNASTFAIQCEHTGSVASIIQKVLFIGNGIRRMLAGTAVFCGCFKWGVEKTASGVSRCIDDKQCIGVMGKVKGIVSRSCNLVGPTAGSQLVGTPRLINSSRFEATDALTTFKLHRVHYLTSLFNFILIVSGFTNLMIRSIGCAT